MSQLTTRQMIDTIRKGDKLGHSFLAQVADRLDLLRFVTRCSEVEGNALMDIRDALGKKRPSGGFPEYAATIHEIVAENERLREAVKNGGEER